MSSTQRSQSAPPRNGRTDSEAENAPPSSGLLKTARSHTTHTLQAQQNKAFSEGSSGAGKATAQGPITKLHPAVTNSEVGQQSNTTTTAHNSGGPNGGNPWFRKTLLTLDGGGVRGVSSLLILRALMREITKQEQRHPQENSSVYPLQPRLRRPVRMQKVRESTFRRAPNQEERELPGDGPMSASSVFLPAHYFDYIAGTSTGGLIAIMLGRLHMTVDECLEAYEKLADHVFGHPRYLHIRHLPWYPPRDKYDHRRLEDVIKEIVRERSPTGSSNTLFCQPKEDMCRTLVLAWQKYNTGTEVPHIFRSYPHPKSNTTDFVVERNPGEPDNHRIWEVGRATSAAPTYFKTIRLEEGDEKSDYIDGGFGANNPAEEAYNSVLQLYNNDRRKVQVLVSIGTGKNLEARRNPSAGYALYKAYANRAVKWAAQSEKTHQTMVGVTRGFTEYFRLNVEHGIGKMKLDAWKGKKGRKTLDLIRTKTQDYLDSPEIQRQITASATELVNIRRARSSQPYIDRWERFCHGVEYACPVATCHGGRDTTYADRQALELHIEENHNEEINLSEGNTLESLLNEGKRFPDETTP